MNWLGKSKRTEPKERSKMLKVTVWLSGTNGLFSIFSHILASFETVGEGDGPSDDILKTLPDLADDIEAYFAAFIDGFTMNNLMLAVLYIMGLIGVFEMYNFRKRGYFMYGVAHLAISFYPVIMVLKNDYSIIMTGQYLAFTALFLVLFGTQLKHMK